MTENVYKLVMLGLVTGSWLFLSSMFLLKRKPGSFLFHAGMWAVLMVYFILYEFLMSYHGEVAWFPAGLVEIAVMMTVVAVNNEGIYGETSASLCYNRVLEVCFLQWRRCHFRSCRSTS